MTEQFHSEQPDQPSEANHHRLTSLIWREVELAEEAIDTAPMTSPVRLLPDWMSVPMEQAHATAFLRSRRLMQGISYRNRYWKADYDLLAEVDRSLFDDDRSTQKTSTLLRLVALSRAPVYRQNDTWSIPTFHDIVAINSDIRAELEVTDMYNDAMEHSFRSPNFPGVVGRTVVNAVLDNSLRMGNPRQPLPHAWFPS